MLRAKAEYYAGELRYAYPVFLAGRLLGPNAAVRRWIGDLERRIHAELGAPALGQRLKSVLGVAAALWTGLTLKLDLFQHPKLIRTTYRVPGRRWGAFEMWEEFQPQSRLARIFPLKSSCGTPRKKSGCAWKACSRASDAEALGERIQDSLARSKSKLVLDFKKARWDKVENLEPAARKAGGLSFAHPRRSAEIVLGPSGTDPSGRHVPGQRRLASLKGLKRDPH